MKAIGVGEYEILGETLDDAAGEALDKVARMLGLEGGGVELEECAMGGTLTRQLLHPNPNPNPKPNPKPNPNLNPNRRLFSRPIPTTVRERALTGPHAGPIILRAQKQREEARDKTRAALYP